MATITGTDGADSITGTIGADSMVGGLGNDTYVVDSYKDVVTENAGEGADWIHTSQSLVLTDNVENERLMGSANINGGGNALDNQLFGNTGNNQLNGNEGNDTMTGGLGDDTYIVDSALDQVVEYAGEGTDWVRSRVSFTLGSTLENLVLTGTDNTNGTGNGASNSLTGNTGANVLDGQGGADTMVGGLGDDTYVVDSYKDVVTENAGEGADWIHTSQSLVLTDNVENERLMGSANINGGGNALDNQLFGNTGNNQLNGNEGNDTMTGGMGDDTYIVDSALDQVVEYAGEGTDWVRSRVSFTLDSTLENLVLTGTDNTNGTGNGANNSLTGNTGANVLDGQGGADTMSGGLGDDTYVISSSKDQVVENADEGTDLVISSRSFALGDNVENAILLGGAAIGVVGNDLDNVLIGNAYDNSITGGAGSDTLDGTVGGNDTMSGGDGGDFYYINGGDDVVEGDAGGYDTICIVDSAIDHFLYTMSSGIESVIVENNHTWVGGNNLNNSIDMGVNDGMVDTYHHGSGVDIITTSIMKSGPMKWWIAPMETPSKSMLLDVDSSYSELMAADANAQSGPEIRIYDRDQNDYSDNLASARFVIKMSSDDIVNINGGVNGDLLIAIGDGCVCDGGDGTDTFFVNLSERSDSIEWKNDGSQVKLANSVTVSNVERLLLGTGGGNDSIDNTAYATNDEIHSNAGNDYIATGAGDDVIDAGDGDDTLIGGDGDDNLYAGVGSDWISLGEGGNDQIEFGLYSRNQGVDTIVGFESGSDIIYWTTNMGGGGGGLIDPRVLITSGDSFSTDAEVVIVTGDYSGVLDAATAADLIGSATGYYYQGQEVLFVVDNGVDSQLYQFASSQVGDTTVSDTELTLLATLSGTASTVVSDYGVY